ncbi:peptidase S8/S53 domain-containing protein [Staphylotrichum tortipilum]|uniref:Peptidase S8/S53 domain-containing protein n=1 Tax=Staphylotrichum tortipilum TaxID=2831512 RepID=A0AAN6RPV3_9PEZI|nr:peptidase S8/S53 domain-containing protein [Staphylotrichum longicolle]
MASAFAAFQWVAIGLLCTLPLFNTVTAAPTPLAEDIPQAAIAIKLNKPTSRTRSLPGPELVRQLIQKAQSGTGLAKRDTTFKVLPLITSITPDDLPAMIHRATDLDPTYEPVDFTAWFQVQFSDHKLPDDGRDPEISQLLNNLAGFHEVASCETLGGAPAPSVHASSNPMFASQGYLSGGGVGIDAQYAWGFPGGDGAGTTIIDIERGWQLTHEDLIAQNITLLSGLNTNDRYGGNLPHGTAVLGELLMRDNTIGGVGIAPSARGHVVGTHRDLNSGPFSENPPDAILSATTFLQPGDLILLEMQAADADYNLWPIEIQDAVYDAIRLATALGITVIEPAGNGGMGLDGPVLRDGDTVPQTFLNRTAPSFRDSGAIMVGAGSSTLPRTRLAFSNHGSRVDVHAWGENIATASVSVGDGYRDSYGVFDGTSGAAPIVAGAALCAQGIVAARRGGGKLAPRELREVMKLGGTGVQGGGIGVQPDLRALIDGGVLV